MLSRWLIILTLLAGCGTDDLAPNDGVSGKGEAIGGPVMGSSPLALEKLSEVGTAEQNDCTLLRLSNNLGENPAWRQDAQYQHSWIKVESGKVQAGDIKGEYLLNDAEDFRNTLRLSTEDNKTAAVEVRGFSLARDIRNGYDVELVGRALMVSTRRPIYMGYTHVDRVYSIDAMLIWLKRYSGEPTSDVVECQRIDNLKSLPYTNGGCYWHHDPKVSYCF